ncbi:MAG: SpoIIE family protein phosphatase [Methylophaga sp.]|nr:SpoIIE family protein phosphatase [Methylophaga sp.]
MSETKSPSVVASRLPNLAPRIIIIVLIVSFFILLTQYIQNNYNKEELLDTKRISLYYQQEDIIGKVASAALQLDNANDVLTDTVYTSIRMAIQELKATQEQQVSLREQFQQLNEADNIRPNEHVIDEYVDQIILASNALLATIESQQFDDQLISKLNEMYQHYQRENAHLITQLATYLQDESVIHQKVSWWLTFFTIALTFIVSLTIYYKGKKLVHQQFNLLLDAKEQIEREVDLVKDREEKLAEESEQRERQQNKLNAILNSTVDAIITITGDGTIDSFNKSAVQMFGYSADSVVGKNIKMLMPEPYFSQHDGYLAHYHKAGEKKIIGHIREVTGRRIDGSEFPLRLSVSEATATEPKLFTGIIRDITRRKKMETELQNTLDELTQKQSALEEEERIARHVFENITTNNNDIIPEVSSWCEPMGTFSGDMMLSAVLPSGGIRVLLCDFTGHGLPAALGAVPVSTIHSAMAKKGLPLEILMNELNNKLNELLPTGIFCCIAGIDIDASRTQAQIWNAGLPEVLVVNQAGEITQRIVSNHLPLGVVAYNKNELHCSEIQLGTGDTIYALSDGLTEAENEVGEMFGQKRFEQLLMNKTDEHGRLIEIRNSIGKFVGKAAATDDISLIEIKTLVTTD